MIHRVFCNLLVFLFTLSALAEAVPHFDVTWVTIPETGQTLPIVDYGKEDFAKGRFFTTTIDGVDYLYEVDSITPHPYTNYSINPKSRIKIKFDDENNHHPAENATVENLLNSDTPVSTQSDAPTSQGSATSETGAGKGAGSLGGLGDSFLKAGASGVQAGVINGLSVYAFRKLVYDSKYQAKVDSLNAAQKSFLEAKKQSGAEINANIAKGQAHLDAALNSLNGLQNTVNNLHNSFNFSNAQVQYNFKSKDPKFTAELSDIRDTLLSSPRTDATGVNIRNSGIEFTKISDEAYSNGDFADAEAFKSFAYSMADLLFGLDPITGTARDIYEGFTGYNLITGEKLSAFERGMAVVGMVSFGYGSKIAKGIKAFDKFSDAFKTSKTVQRSFAEARKSINAFQNSKVYQKYKLWKTEGFLNKHNPELLSELRSHPKGDVYLKHLSNRKNLKISHRYNAEELIEQELSIDALEAIDEISKGNWVARQGNFGLDEDEIRAVLKANPRANVDQLMHGSRLTIGRNVQDQSIYFGKIADDIGTVDYAMRHGAYSTGADFVEISKLGPKADFITRTAPGGKAGNPLTGEHIFTPGGSIEVIVKRGSIEKSSLILLNKDTTSKEIQQIISNRIGQ